MRCFVLMWAVILLVTMTRSLAQSKDEELIAHTKRINVRRLDSRLSSQQFAYWLKGIVGPNAIIGWEVNDCGEQTGTPADKGRDFPLCVQAEAKLPDGRKAVLRISVGTFRKGWVGKPRLYDGFVEHEGRLHTIKQLGDLPEVLFK